jgi:hypothetical protein
MAISIAIFWAQRCRESKGSFIWVVEKMSGWRMGIYDGGLCDEKLTVEK